MMENKSDDDYVVDEEEECGNDSDSDIEESQVDGLIYPTQVPKRNLYMAYAAGAQEENAVKNKKKKN